MKIRIPFDNDRLSHWFIGAIASWAAMFLFVGLAIFHLLLKVRIEVIAMFCGIFAAGQLATTPLIFSARATQQNPTGRLRLRAISITLWLSASILLFLCYIRLSRPIDSDTRLFLTIMIVLTVAFAVVNLVRYGFAFDRQK